MRTRTDTLIFRLGFALAVLVLTAFLALVGAVVFACTTLVGGPVGWVVGVALGLAVVQALRGRCGALVGRLVA
jgi:1,4-dihydroxy-2-naphthoate octaprenyltransferase